MGVNHPSSLGPVVVTDGETRTALACVRSLGARGIETHVLAARPPGLAGASRHAAAVHRVPDAEAEPQAWADAVLARMANLPGALLLPVTEVALGNLYALGLERSVRAAAPPREAYERAVDKHALIELAAGCGIDAPRSTLLEDPQSLSSLPPGYEYPVVVKARRSRWLEGGRWRQGVATIVRDEPALRAALAQPGFAAGALLQEFVPGTGEGLFFLVDHGRPVLRFAHRRLREKPPSGGVSVLSESVEPPADLAARSERLLEALGWHGVAMVEFRRSPGGRAAIMELNPRLWGSLQLAIDAGADFPGLVVALARGAALPSVSPRAGVRTRWLMGDVDHLWIAARDPAMRQLLGRSFAAMLRAFLASFFDGTRSEIFRWSDPRPALEELRTWLR